MNLVLTRLKATELAREHLALAGRPTKLLLVSRRANHHEAAVLMRRLNAACLVVLAYLSSPRQ